MIWRLALWQVAGAHIKAMFVAGKMVVENDQIPDVDMMELAWQAKQSVKLLQQRSVEMAKIA